MKWGGWHEGGESNLLWVVEKDVATRGLAVPVCMKECVLNSDPLPMIYSLSAFGIHDFLQKESVM